MDKEMEVEGVIAATNTLQNFSLASFWSLPTNHPQQCVLDHQAYRLQLFLSVLSTCACQFASLPSQVSFLDLNHVLAKKLPPKNCTILEGN